MHHFAGKVHRSPAELPADKRVRHVVKIGLHAHSRRNVFRIDDIPRFPPKASLETSDRQLFLVNEDGLVLVLDQRPDYVALERAGAVDRIVEDILVDSERDEVALHIAVDGGSRSQYSPVWQRR